MDTGNIPWDPWAEGRPDFVKEEHLIFLDELRESGETNMFGAPKYVAHEFLVNKEDAQGITRYWMDTFGKDTR